MILTETRELQARMVLYLDESQSLSHDPMVAVSLEKRMCGMTCSGFEGGVEKRTRSVLLLAGSCGFLMLDVLFQDVKWCLHSLKLIASLPLNNGGKPLSFFGFFGQFSGGERLVFGECSGQGLDWDSTHQHWKDWQEGHPSKIARISHLRIFFRGGCCLMSM